MTHNAQPNVHDGNSYCHRSIVANDVCLPAITWGLDMPTSAQALTCLMFSQVNRAWLSRMTQKRTGEEHAADVNSESTGKLLTKDRPIHTLTEGGERRRRACSKAPFSASIYGLPCSSSTASSTRLSTTSSSKFCRQKPAQACVQHIPGHGLCIT